VFVWISHYRTLEIIVKVDYFEVIVSG